jgi:hypothetical protein
MRYRARTDLYRGRRVIAVPTVTAWAIQAFDKQHAARDDRISVLMIFLCSVGYLLYKLYLHTKRRRVYASHDRT